MTRRRWYWLVVGVVLALITLGLAYPGGLR